jgi:hypothetical protein
MILSDPQFYKFPSPQVLRLTDQIPFPLPVSLEHDKLSEPVIIVLQGQDPHPRDIVPTNSLVSLS